MKRLLGFLLLLATSAFAQSYHVYDVVWLASGKPAPNSPIRVCASGATGTPCSPLANVYSDQGLTQLKTQPFATDSLGNYDFWVASPARYVVEYYPQGSPVAVHQILTAPVTSDLPPGQPGPAGQDGAPGTPGYSPSQILSGCGVGYTGGLNFLVGPCKYLIASSQGGTTINIQTNTALTGPAADPALNRFDAIVGNTAGQISIVPGIASVNPGCPVLDPTSQVQIFCYEVDAGATTPANINILDIYHENAEWTCAVSAHLNCASTVNPHTGTKDVEATAAVLTNFARFTIPAGTLDIADYNDLIFNIASKANWAGLSLTLQWYNGTTAKCTPVTLFNGQFGFDSTRTAYQQVDVPLRLFNCNGIPVTRLQYTVSGTGTSLGFYLDDIYLQGGATNSIGSDFMKWQHGTVGTNGWSSSKQYKINDTVTRNGNTYTAIADSTNAPPETNPLIWDPHTTFAPGGVDGNLQYKVGNTFGGFNTSISGNDIVFPGKITATEFDSSATDLRQLTLDDCSGGTCPTSGAGQVTFVSNAGVCQVSQNGGPLTACGTAFGAGTVTSFSSGNLSPLFTTSVATATTTPALSFTISNAAAHTFYGNTSGSTGAPSFSAITVADLPSGDKIRDCEIVIGDPGSASPALADDNDTPAVCQNDFGADYTITAVSCYANAGSPTVTPILTGGSGTSILSGALTCGTASFAAGTVNGTPTVHSFSANGATCSSTPCSIDANITTAGGTAKYIVIKIKRSL